MGDWLLRLWPQSLCCPVLIKTPVVRNNVHRGFFKNPAFRPWIKPNHWGTLWVFTEMLHQTEPLTFSPWGTLEKWPYKRSLRHWVPRCCILVAPIVRTFLSSVLTAHSPKSETAVCSSTAPLTLHLIHPRVLVFTRFQTCTLLSTHTWGCSSARKDQFSLSFRDENQRAIWRKKEHSLSSIYHWFFFPIEFLRILNHRPSNHWPDRITFHIELSHYPRCFSLTSSHLHISFTDYDCNCLDSGT